MNLASLSVDKSECSIFVNAQRETIILYFVQLIYLKVHFRLIFTTASYHSVVRTESVYQQIIHCHLPLSTKFPHCCCVSRLKSRHVCLRFIILNNFRQKSFNKRHKNMVCSFFIVTIETLI